MGIDDVPAAPPRDTGPIIRNRKRRPLHPEEIQKRLRDRANANVVLRTPTAFGWLVILYPDAGGRIVRETGEGATYEDAHDLLEKEQRWTGPCDAWIVAKQHPGQRTVLP
jgi:hypothetical protein